MPPSTGAAELFVDRDYSGASLSLTEGSYNIGRLEDPVGNDTVTSLKVAPGYTVTVYTDADFGGTSKTFTTDTPYVGDDLNEQISSVTVNSTTRTTPKVGSEGGQQVVFIQPPGGSGP